MKNLGKAWHGSPKNFNRFAASKVETGEGESKHGWGIYLTSQQDRAEFYAKLKVGSGTIYLVELNDGVYLDWDKELSEQPEATAAIRASLPPNVHYTPEIDPAEQFDLFVNRYGWRGKDGYKHLAMLFGTDSRPNKKRASLALQSHGLTGITYLGCDNWDGGGVTGYVIFDPEEIKIVSKMRADHDFETAPGLTPK